MKNRNIIMITLDSLRADHCSFLGYHRNTTPTIDKMAKDGIYFSNAISSSVPTGPSMFSIFTGSFTHNNATDYAGKRWRKELSASTTVTEILKRKGYETIAFNTNPFTSSFFGFDKGFNTFCDVSENERAINLGTKSRFTSFKLNVRKILYKTDTVQPWEAIYPQILSQFQKSKTPFFGWIILLDTHTPYFPSNKYRKWCKTNFFRLLYLYWKLERQQWKTSEVIKDIIDAYDDEIYYADKFISTLWSDLKDKEPIFVIHADHGDGLGEHGFYHHPPLLYEELIRVPLVIYNAESRKVIENPTSLSSLFHIILRLANVENRLSEENLLNHQNEWVISKVFEKNVRKIAIRMKNWKYISGQIEKEQIFNLKKDPYEKNNLYETMPTSIIKEFQKILRIHVSQEIEMRKLQVKSMIQRVRPARLY